MEKEIKIEEAPENVFPHCPHCKTELRKIWVKKKGLGFIQQRQVLLCPHCQSFLGYGVVKFT